MWHGQENDVELIGQARRVAGQALGGMRVAFGASAELALIGALSASRIGPEENLKMAANTHADLPSVHPHLAEERLDGRARHAFLIYDRHSHWLLR